MAGMARRSNIGRRVFLALAVLALAFQVLVPPGFMVSDGPSHAIVICTGHGSVTASLDDHGRPAKSPKDNSDHACPFAGHGGTPLLLSPQSVERAIVVPPLDGAVGPVADLAPGRGLAAPPPPSQGPPQVSI